MFDVESNLVVLRADIFDGVVSHQWTTDQIRIVSSEAVDDELSFILCPGVQQEVVRMELLTRSCAFEKHIPVWALKLDVFFEYVWCC